jgi:hypothetical protein
VVVFTGEEPRLRLPKRVLLRRGSAVVVVRSSMTGGSSVRLVKRPMIDDCGYFFS